MQESITHYPEIAVPVERTVYDDIVYEAQKWIGSSSVRHNSLRPDLGMSPETGLDCSGYITFVFNNLNIPVPKAKEPGGVDRFYCNLALDEYGVMVQLGLQKPGDLIIFSRNGLIPTHMGIVVSPTTYVHAPGEDGTTVELRSIQQQRIVPESHDQIIYHTNPIAIKRPMLREGRWAKPLEKPLFQK